MGRLLNCSGLLNGKHLTNSPSRIWKKQLSPTATAFQRQTCGGSCLRKKAVVRSKREDFRAASGSKTDKPRKVAYAPAFAFSSANHGKFSQSIPARQLCCIGTSHSGKGIWAR